MANDPRSVFPMLPLSELGITLYDCDHRTPKPAIVGYPYVAIPNIKNGHIDLTEIRYISHEDYLSWIRRTKPQAGDIIMTRRARVGDIAVIPRDFECAIGQNLLILRSDNQQIQQDYLRWVLRGPLYRQEVEKFLNVGAVFDSLNISDIPKLRIPVPSLSEQRAIAEILGSLDDKIELNRRMNATLEETARALFKSWFVDFDPVRARMESRQPDGMDAETAALFPDRLVESELGPIPEGWRVSHLSDHVEAVKGLSYKGSGLADSGTPLHNLNSIYEGGGYKYEGIKYYSGEYRERHIIKAGDLIVANTEQGHHKLLIGYPAIIPQRYGDQGLFSHHLYKVTPLSDSPMSTVYLYFLLKTDLYHDLVSGFTNGTTVNMLPSDGLEKPLIVVPPQALIGKFSDVSNAMLRETEANFEQSQSLAAIRDALLPKLLSGQVRVEESEGYTEEIL